MKKAIKFLLFVIALFVTVNVKALQEDIIIDGGKSLLGGASYKYVQGDSNSYVFCLDSARGFTSSKQYKMSTSIPGISGSKVRNVILKSFLMGLGSESNEYGISKDDFYIITQIAVWHAAHGSDTSKSSGGGVSEDPNHVYNKWLDEVAIRREIYNTLIGVEDVEQIIQDVKFDSDNVSMKLSDDKQYFVSDEISIKGSGNLNYTVKASEGACVLYNNKCESTASVKAGEKFQLRTDNNSDKVSVSASVVSSTSLKGYEFGMYVPNDTVEPSENDVVQRTAVFSPIYDISQDEITVEGKNEAKIIEKRDLKVSKTDATNQAEIGGADIYIYDLDGKEFTHWTSEEGKTHYVKDLVVDKIYRLEETVAPTGYDKLTTDIYFKVNEDGSVTTCKADVVKSNGTCEAMSSEEMLNIKNYPTKGEVKTGKVVISKKDFTNDNQEVIGAHLQILDENGNIVASWESDGQLHEFELPVGKYTLVETIPAPNYDADMYIIGNPTSSYEFEITEDGVKKIDVYNKLKATKIDVPITGMSVTSLYVIGGLVTLAGASVVVYAKKKENM